MKTGPIWGGAQPASAFPALDGNLAVDVAVVGGGITGLTTAALLADAGRSVAVLEARRIGEGTTGNSTGNLYAVVSTRLHAVRKKWDDEVMRAVAVSRGEAVDFIEQTAGGLGVDCRFVRCPLHLYATSEAKRQSVVDECDAARSAGLAARLTRDTSELPVRALGEMLVIEDQAQLDPLGYVRGLAHAVAGGRCRVFENTPALAVDEGKHVVETPRGKVMAQEVVLATHTPKGIYAVQSEMSTHREYGLAFPLDGQRPGGIYWGMGDFNQSFRTTTSGGRTYGVLIGPEHKTGGHDAEAALGELESYAAEHFPGAAIERRWSAQNYHGSDHLPYIGRTRASDAYIATGFGTDGLVYGTVAARIIADAILGSRNRWAQVYDARRFDPTKSGPGFVKENVNVVKALLARLAPAERAALDEIVPGSARVVKAGGEKVAAYRDESGTLHALSPVCSHLHCEVTWNGAEKSWDCPCHGSRFDIEGAPIEGPALKGLERYTQS